MSTATLTKVGNSQAVIIPKKIREEAGYNEDTHLNVHSPRAGVVVVTAIREPNEDRQKIYSDLMTFLDERSERIPMEQRGLTAEELLEMARSERAKTYFTTA